MSEVTSKVVEKASTQDEATRKAVLESSSATAGSGSATGQALADLRGEEDTPQGKERGAPEEPLGAPKGGDFGEGAASKPVGLQAEPAAFGVNGTIPSGMVASPSGHIPVGAAGTSEEALRVTYGRQPIQGDVDQLDERTVASLTGPDLRAIGEQRGYKITDTGSRSARRAFLEAQDADPRFAKSRKAAGETTKKTA